MSGSCTKCNGVGSYLVGPEVAVRGLTIGQRVECECAEEFRETERNAKRSRLWNASGVPSRYQSARLTDLPEAAREAITAWIGTPDGWIYLWGGVGTGKTHTAAAIVRETCRQMWTTLWASASDAACKICERGGEAELSRLRGCGVLVLDDLALRVPNAQQSEALYRLLDHRYGEQKPTIITSNVSVDDLAKVAGFDRIADRIREEARGRIFASQKYRRAA